MSAGSTEDRGTARTEAFSDGVLAIAMTLLVLDLRDPTAGGTVSLAEGLLIRWPAFFALATSGVTILIIWMNHHNMFNYIRRVDRRFMLFNGFLLFFVVLTPFTTALVANHLLSGDAGVAATVYAGTFFLLSVVWNGLWWYSSTGHRLLGANVTAAQVKSITRQYYVAPVAYGLALLISPVSALVSVAVILAVAGFYAITASIGKEVDVSSAWSSPLRHLRRGRGK